MLSRKEERERIGKRAGNPVRDLNHVLFAALSIPSDDDAGKNQKEKRPPRTKDRPRAAPAVPLQLRRRLLLLLIGGAAVGQARRALGDVGGGRARVVVVGSRRRVGLWRER